MKDDPTISRIRTARKEISARFGHNIEKLARHYMKRQEKHGHKLIKTSESHTHMIIHVIQAKIIKDYTVELVFDDLKKGIVNLRKYLGCGIFKELLDQKKFRQMKVDAELGTICWPNGADIAPDTLYLDAR